MSSYKVTMDNGSNVITFETDKATDALKAAFLAGVNYGGDMVLVAHAIGALGALLEMAGPEIALGSLLQVAELDTITVTGDPDQIITTSSRDPRDYGI